MRLVKLVICNGRNLSIIREIKFNYSGLSLIVDSESTEGSGSSIGKTTLVKIIDLCLGAKDPKSIYFESDTGANEIVKNFIEDNSVYADLFVVIKNVEYKLSRDLFPGGKFRVNDEIVKKNQDILKDLFFPNSGDLTLRMLISKFVRLDTSNEDSLFKYLPGSYNSDITYQAIYEYLFGIKSSKVNQLKLAKQKKVFSADLKTIFRKASVANQAQMEGRIKLLSKKVTDIEFETKKIVVVPDYEIKEIEYSKILNQISQLQIEKVKWEILVREFQERTQYEKSNFSNIDHSILHRIYEDTEISFGKIEKEFYEFEEFHNAMISKRLDLLECTLREYEGKFNESSRLLADKRREYEIGYKDFNFELKKKYDDIIVQYDDTKRQLDALSSDYDFTIKLNADIELLKEKLKSSEDLIGIKDEVQNKFNKIFQETTKKVIGEDYLMVFAQEENTFPITMVGLEGNPGNGMKKALIYCFDASYIQYIMNENIEFPFFIIHDKMENVPLDELKGIMNSATKFEGQYILPILSDRIESLKLDEKFVVLKLSKTQKLFKI